MFIIQMNVSNQRLTRYTAGVVSSDSAGYLKLKFVFRTNDWESVSVKMANFSYRGRNYPVLIEDDNTCFVPKEVIKTPSFSVSVFGGGITSNIVKIPVENSGIGPCEDESISVKYYNEIINKLTATIDDLNESKADNIIYNEDENYIQLTANGQPIGDQIQAQLCSCGIKSFDVDENDNITITLLNDRVIELGNIEGASGATFIPHISEDLILSWTNDKNLPNPEPVDISPFNDWIDDGVTESDYIWEDE